MTKGGVNSFRREHGDECAKPMKIKGSEDVPREFCQIHSKGNVRILEGPLEGVKMSLGASVTIYLSLFHPASLDLIVTSPPRCLITTSPHHPTNLSPYHLTTLLSCHHTASPPCHPVTTLPLCHLVISSPGHPAVSPSPPRTCPRLILVLTSYLSSPRNSSSPCPRLVLVPPLSSSCLRLVLASFLSSPHLVYYLRIPLSIPFLGHSIPLSLVPVL